MTQLIAIHIITAIFSQFLALCAAFFSLLSLSKYKLLKKRHITQFFHKTPSIETLDNYFAKCLWLGFILLTFTLATGVYLFYILPLENNDLDFKLTWALLTWCWYLAAIFIKSYLSGVRKLITQISLFICILLLLVYFILIF